MKPKMKIHLGNANLKGVTLTSILFTPKFDLVFKTENDIHEINLKAENAHIGYIFETNQTKIIFRIKFHEKTLESHEIAILEKNEIKFENWIFEGKIEFRKIPDDTFMYFECLLSGQEIVDTKFSKNLEGNNSLRLKYDGTKYSVNSLEILNYAPNENAGKLPHGWEFRLTKNGCPFYVDHNTKTTHRKVARYESGEYLRIVDLLPSMFRTQNSFFRLFRDFYDINVVRKFVIETSYKKLIEYSKKKQSTKIKITFVNEIGGDGGGLFREYFDLVCDELCIDPRLEYNNGFYDIKKLNIDDIIEKQRGFCSIKENEFKNQMNNREFLNFIGSFLAVSLQNTIPLKISFTLSFYENLLNRNYKIENVQDMILQRSILQLKRNEIDLSNLLEVDLRTEAQRDEYISNYLYNSYFLAKEEEYEIIRQSFYKLANDKITKNFTAFSISFFLSGPNFTDLEYLRSLVFYVNCGNKTKEIKFLWKILEDKGPDYVRKFLSFVTGSGKIPVLKNKDEYISIEKCNQDNMLIRSATCIMRLWIGKYENIEDMERIMTYCLDETEGFHAV